MCGEARQGSGAHREPQPACRCRCNIRVHPAALSHVTASISNRNEPPQNYRQCHPAPTCGNGFVSGTCQAIRCLTVGSFSASLTQSCEAAIMNRRSPIVTVQLALVATALFLVEAVALCLPALVNRGPILFTDTHGYYVGGRAALDKARAVFERHDGGTGAESVGTVVQNARAVRSAF